MWDDRFMQSAFPGNLRLKEQKESGIDMIGEKKAGDGMKKLHTALSLFSPWNEQEERDRQEIIRRIESGENLLTRDNLSAHLTASAWVTDASGQQILMAWHNLYRSWSWLGGHADGETDLLKTALKEVREEAGITRVRPLAEEIFSVEILTVDGHEKRGVYVPSHLHLNVTYLMVADPAENTRNKPDENSMVKWFGLDDAIEASCEPWMRDRIYSKLNGKLISRLKKS